MGCLKSASERLSYDINKQAIYMYMHYFIIPLFVSELKIIIVFFCRYDFNCTIILVYFRVFVLLVAMGQKSLSGPCAVTILESLLDMLAKVLSPILTGQPSSSQTGTLDVIYIVFKGLL